MLLTPEIFSPLLELRLAEWRLVRRRALESSATGLALNDLLHIRILEVLDAELGRCGLRGGDSSLPVGSGAGRLLGHATVGRRPLVLIVV